MEKCFWVIQKSRKVIRSTGNELTIPLCCISQHAHPMKQYTWFKFKQSQCIYCQIIYVYENKHISAPEHSVKSFFENRMKIQDKKNPLRNGGTAVLTVCGKLELIDNCRTSKNAKYWLEFCSVIIVDNANENSVGRAYLTSRYLCKDLSRWRFVLSNSSCEMQMCYTIKYLS